MSEADIPELAGARPSESAAPAERAPWWRQARSLKIEIAFAFGVVIALMLALGGAFYLSEQRSAFALDKLLKSDGRMADLSLRSALAMLKAGDAESEFRTSVERIGLKEARERYVAPMQSHLIDMREYLTSMRILSNDPLLREKIDRVEQLTQQYEDGFLAYVDQYGKPDRIGVSSQSRQDYTSFALSIDPLLEDLHTMASRRALATLSGVERAAKLTRWTVFGAVSIATLLGAIVAVVVWRRITGSVTQLVIFSKRVAGGDLSARAAPSNEHEFAVLARAMNKMAASLEHSQAQLLAAARVAGMAEIATNVLHNVGNVLNSVNVSASLVGARLRGSKLKRLGRAAELLNDHAGDLGAFMSEDPRGKLLPAYLRELASTLEGEHADMADELQVLGRSVEHIKEIVAIQQSFAGARRLLESIRIGDLVDEALRMSAGTLARHKVDVVIELGALPALPLDRNRVLQILVNLISNATCALRGADGASARITLGAALLDGARLRVSVADNGEGIAPENLTRIFAHGFTTRPDGHGFGLHSSVLAAQEMGGSLAAHSDGPGRGATFVLELPVDGAPGPADPTGTGPAP